MRQGGTCGCITASLLVLGLALGFYDAQDREQEVYGNKKTDEFIQRFTKQMNGKVYCRDILGKDISKPEDMAIIRKEKLILQKCPKAMAVSISILEDMLADYLRYKAQNSVNLEDILKDEELKSVIKRTSKLHNFRRNINNLLYTCSKEVGFIQFDIRKFKIINDIYGERFGNEVLDFILKKLEECCGKDKLFINLRSDVSVSYTHLSNFITSKGVSRRIFKEEYPLPKSSISNLKPSSFNSNAFRLICWSSAVSVISNSNSRLGI